MSYISSPAPSKPGSCTTEEWNALENVLLCDKDEPLNQLEAIKDFPNNVEKMSCEIDIANLEIYFANNSSLNENSDGDKQTEFQEEQILMFENKVMVPVNNVVITTVNENFSEEGNNQNDQFNILDIEDHLSNHALNDNNGNLLADVEEKEDKSRKRTKTPSKWKQNVRREKRLHGECYVNTKGKLQVKKSVQEACRSTNCPFKCAIKITHEERKEIHRYFWTLSDELKSHFYSKHIKRFPARRKRTQNEQSCKTFSYEYFFIVKEVPIRVCQEYFLKTLNISKKRIYYFFKKVQPPNASGPREALWGKHKKKIISDERKIEVRSHIESFPVVDSHYCRSTSKKKYLERDLNIKRMYNLYLVTTQDPVTFHAYSDIFNNEYNIAFLKPKKDLCDKCEEFRVTKYPCETKILEYEEHLKRKSIGKEERDRDRKRCKNNMDENSCVVTYDLQNVFSLPKAYVGGYYYKSKLNTYNLTGHCSIDGCIYNAIWHEYICGRGGTHLASGVIKILKAVISDHPNLTKITLWSDSCVPQNRNSILSFALQNFLNSEESKMLLTIEHKYSEPGHGSIQEIDSAHSCIERYIKNLEVWSPITLIRILTHMPTHWKMKFKVLQMTANDYLSYKPFSESLSYNLIPYTKVKHMVYEKRLIWNIKYKENFEEQFQEVKLSYKKTRNTKNTDLQLDFPKAINKLSELNIGITSIKKQALQDMLSQMPEEEKRFYEVIISKVNTAKKIGTKAQKNLKKLKIVKKLLNKLKKSSSDTESKQRERNEKEKNNVGTKVTKKSTKPVKENKVKAQPLNIGEKSGRLLRNTKNTTSKKRAEKKQLEKPLPNSEQDKSDDQKNKRKGKQKR